MKKTIRNQIPLTAMREIMLEVSNFLDGWGDFREITIDWQDKTMNIKIQPK